jgi:hypothetical protein
VPTSASASLTASRSEQFEAERSERQDEVGRCFLHDLRLSVSILKDVMVLISALVLRLVKAATFSPKISQMKCTFHL